MDSDERVLRALMRDRKLTRAELATAVGISKPTAGESVRRLEERGVVVDTGERTPGGRGRGRVGSYYSLAPAAGTALAVGIAPEGVVAERLDAYGEVVSRASREIGRPADPAEVAAALTAVVSRSTSQVRATPLASASELEARLMAIGVPADGEPPRRGSMDFAWPDARPEARVRLAVVSAADPVDRATGRLVHLPDAPFLVGALDPVGILRDFVDGPIVVDNDVNWAARAEDGGTDFAYLFLGEGLCAALTNDGVVRRGATGLAGEIAHLITRGPGGRATAFIDVFGELGLRRPGSTAIDPQKVLAAGPEVHEAVAVAVAGVVSALVTLTDPALVVIGGGWGPHLLPAITAAVARLPRGVPLRAALAVDEPALAGARRDAVDRLRATIVADA